MQIFVKSPQGKTITLDVESHETIGSVKRKLQDKEGNRADLQILTYGGMQLRSWRPLHSYNIFQRSILGTEMICECPKPNHVMSQKNPLAARPEPQLPPRQIKRARSADGEVLAASADRKAMPDDNYDTKLKFLALHQAKANAALIDLMPEFQARPPTSVLADLEDAKRELVTARSKEKELEATISGLAHKNRVLSAQCLLRKPDSCLEAENKETKQVLTVARSKEKELEATICRLTHKSKVFSGQCASYESQLVALEAENKKTKEELMVADKKYYSGARVAGYAEGLKEGKTKWLKSVEFLHHLTDASMQYLDYGFESCRKQAEMQGFVGQLDKDSALEKAPDLKGWESSAQTE